MIRYLVILLLFLSPWSITFSDEVTISRGDREIKLVGRILVEAQNGNGILFQSIDGRLWPLDPEEISSVERQDSDFEPLSRKELGKQIRNELNDEFKIHEAGEFVIVYNTEKDYARWVAGLYRRLDRAFKAYWTRKKFKPSEPEFPLAVIIFKNRAEYDQYMIRELGTANPEMIAYYNIESNRVAMFDLTADQLRSTGSKNGRRINEVLNNARAIPMVATIIHEGIHLLMFNNGMQTRFSDTPLWINEGLAMYFEVPDLSANNGWRQIGEVNFLRFNQILRYLPNRPDDSLKNMIRSDQSFRDQNALNMYAQAWAFNYFLLNRHKEEFVEYLKHMSEKPRLIYDTPEQRLFEFQSFFEDHLADLDREFVHYIRSLKNR